jgi:probable phosphoglycerate mutase
MTTTYRQVRFQAPEGATEILLVRHGETVPADPDSPFDLVDGHGDPELAPEGREQAELLGRRLADERGRIDALYVTNLRRTAQTAAPIARALGLEPRVEPDLREVLLGEWEGGLYRRHVMERHPLALEMAQAERWDVIPGAESNETLAARLRAGIGRICADHPSGRVVAVVHGGVIGTILSLASGSRPFAFLGADNGSVSSIVVMGHHWAVRGFNDVSHLNTAR